MDRYRATPVGASTEGENERVRLVVIFGGRSAEHEVSCISAASVLGALDPARYAVEAVAITPAGAWVSVDDATAQVAGGARSVLAVGSEIAPHPAVSGGNQALRHQGPSVVIPLVHGPLGEDGTLQGMLELAGVAYVGTGVLGSALCMDKVQAKHVLAGAGIAQARYLGWRDRGDLNDLTGLVEAELRWPVFVKPANLGSSVGISRVAGPEDLLGALEVAAAYDEWLVVEEGVTAREIECGVLGNLDFEVSVPGEIVPAADFYDFDDKYSGSGAELRIPAALDPVVVEDVQTLAVAAATALRVEGMARVDLFYDEGGRGLLVNEINTIPGFTPQSMFPRLWAASGLAYPALIDRLVALALERHGRRARRIGHPR